MSKYPLRFWLLNLIQMVERLAYWAVVIQLPIYIAQKDADGGLGWEQTDKGIIFLIWALVANLTPIFSGALADKYGRKNLLFASFFLIITGFVLMGSQTEFLPFLLSCVVVGLGLGTFKPAIQGEIALVLDKGNSSVGWGIYVMLVNAAVFFGPPLSIYLKSISWTAVFWGSAAVFSLNFILILFLKSSSKILDNAEKPLDTIKQIIQLFRTPQTLFIVLLLSGFTINYMQFYETLPNFIFDWSDTSAIAGLLPTFMTSETSRGVQVAYEWMYNLNAGFIIIAVVLVSKLMSKIAVLKSIRYGVTIAVVGLLLAGMTQSGMFLVAGMLVYTLGEMITNPRFNEYMGKIAPTASKSAFMGFMGVSWAIGLGGGAIFGGWMYRHFGEKSGFAIKYLNENFPELSDITHSNALSILRETMNLTESEATTLLWNHYDPYLAWLPFVFIGLLSVIGLWLYSRKYGKLRAGS